ncbi:interferon alpha-inducible protein 27-like protein 1 [Palaemon carinicauda]|uniref:interferon alpha-inducible protein 27-like protein 1 n=1 Tax=Palaemon carinicauda TaxID=392227 RepID=UPI0035B5C2CB
MAPDISKSALIGAAVGVGCIFAAPVVLTGMGFTAVGISGGSLAASMMSKAAVANGGGVAPGSTVAILQSVAARGFAVGTKVAAVTAIAAAGAMV